MVKDSIVRVVGKRALLSKLITNKLGAESSIKAIKNVFVNLLRAKMKDVTSKMMDIMPKRDACGIVMYLSMKLKRVNLDLPMSSMDGDKKR